MNQECNYKKNFNFGTGISDVHNFIGVQLKCDLPKNYPKTKLCRSFKNFDENDFLLDLENYDFNISSFENVNEAYKNFSEQFLKVADKHAPFKERKILAQQVPYMNKDLKRAIYRKRMLYNKYQRIRTDKNWDLYRQQRNYVTKLKKKSMNTYFIERCAGGPKSSDFWPTVKPFLTNKAGKCQKETIISENNKLIIKQDEVSEHFNNFFVNVAKNIGNNDINVDDSHPSISAIKGNMPECQNNSFSFSQVDEDFVRKRLNKINVKKATGIDGISPKLLSFAKPVILRPLTELINMSLSSSVFPDQLKVAQVAPIHKKNSVLEKGNYRPVSVLPTISKNFENSIETQLVKYFDTIFNPFLAAFRSGFGCQSTLLRVIEDWKKNLDQNEYLAAILMDLSKVFDCLPHDLLLLKLKAYGLSKPALDLLNSYLSERTQCVKINQTLSSMKDFNKGVPQGSI